MTIIFPDVSEYEGAYNFGPYPIGVARAAISNVKDREWETNKASCAAKGIRLAGYAFLNSPSLGVSVNAQAEFAYSVIGTMPCMLDIEPNRGACASFADVLTWITHYRSLGGVCHLCYLPQWVWVGPLGTPSLAPLSQASVYLVSSNYTTYSDTGIGWRAYGGVAPVQWQFTDNLNGSGADGNAYKGTADEWWAMMVGETMTDADIPDTHRLASNGDTWSRALVTGEDPAHYLGGAGVGVPSTTKNVLHEKIDALSTLLGTLANRPQVAATLTDTQVTSLAASVAQAVVGNHDALSAVDLASVQAATEAAIRDVLGSLK